MTQPTGLAENNRLKRYARSLGIVVPRRGSTTDVMRRFIRTYFAEAAATAGNTAAEARRVRTVEAAAAVVEPLRGNSSADSNDAIPAFRPVEAPVTTQFRGEPVAISERENANFMLTTMQYSASAVLKEESALGNGASRYASGLHALAARIIRGKNLLDTDFIRIRLISGAQKISTHMVRVADHVGAIDNLIAQLYGTDDIGEDDRIIVTAKKMSRGSGYLVAMNAEEENDKQCMLKVSGSTGCFYRSMVIMVAHRSGKLVEFKKLARNDRGALYQTEMAKALAKACSLDFDKPAGLPEIMAVVDYYATQGIHVQVNIVDSNALLNTFTVIYPEDKTGVEVSKIYLRLRDKHYQPIKGAGVGMGMTSFLNIQYFCHTCRVGYHNRKDHKCSAASKVYCHRCKSCNDCSGSGADGKVFTMERIECTDCGCTFFGEACYARHKVSICDKFYFCKKCCRSLKKKETYLCENGIIGDWRAHQCHFQHCDACDTKVDMDTHQCYLQRTTPKEQKFNGFIFFDLETYTSAETQEIIPNLAVAEYGYSSSSSSNNNASQRFVFESTPEVPALDAFMKWLVQKKHSGYTVIAHNGKGFDFIPVLGWCVNNGHLPKNIIQNGSKVPWFKLKKKGFTLQFLDSINFLLSALSELPRTFGFEKEVMKGYFPHYFNKPENWSYVGPYPAAEYYGVDDMKESKRDAFIKWHDEKVNNNDVFDFKQDILAYCIDDVKILKRACLEFDQMQTELNGISPFSCKTIASYCMTVYKANHVPENSIATNLRKVHRDNYSAKSQEYLQWMEHSTGITLETAFNGGEYCATPNLRVDGYCRNTNTIYQFHGCYWHGCQKCYRSITVNETKKMTMRQLDDKTKVVTARLRAIGYTVVEMYEHTWDAMKKEQKEIRAYLQQGGMYTNTTHSQQGGCHSGSEPLNIRDSFSGGRTNATKLKCSVDPGSESKLKYVDICSLYPSVMRYDRYPVGYPTRIPAAECDIERLAAGSEGDSESYFGFVKCRVLPPRGLYHPVLSEKIIQADSMKLVAALCRSCAASMNQETCACSDDERALVGTWATPEINMAIKKGYRILEIFEIQHFEQSSTELFKSYIDQFLKIKAEASGYPSWVHTDSDKILYVERYHEAQGIILDQEKIVKNGGLRAIAKIMLNSFWGKFGQRDNFTQHKFITTNAQYEKILTDDTLADIDDYELTNDVLLIWYKNKDRFIRRNTMANIAIASFTTSHARMRLYKELDMVDDRVVYMDTDSIVYISTPDASGSYDIEVPSMDLLGHFTDELGGGKYIDNFVSTGPKSYAYRVADAEGVHSETVCKLKGFTLSHRNAKLIHFESMNDLVSGFQSKINTVTYNKICRNRYAPLLYSKDEETKSFRLTYTKRVIQPEVSRYGCTVVDTLPYGY